MIIETFHNKAIEHFDKKAEELLALLKPYPENKKETTKYRGSTAEEPAIEIKDEDIEVHSSGLIDGFGREFAKYFGRHSSRVGLEGNDYEAFNSLATKLAVRKETRDFLSHDFTVSAR